MLDAQLTAAAIPDVSERRLQGATTMLSRMTARATRRGLRTRQEIVTGPRPGVERLLAAAGNCAADLIVVGRDTRPYGSG